jgi:hypothetical protein
MVDKVIRDGQVAVLVSPGYGAGWSTWNSNEGEAAVFCPRLVNAVLEGRSPQELAAIAAEVFPEAYLGGVDDLCVEWVNQGDRFIINEYDGSESLDVLGPDYGYAA